jgi:hypothetical protein
MNKLVERFCTKVWGKTLFFIAQNPSFPLIFYTAFLVVFLLFIFLIFKCKKNNSYMNLKGWGPVVSTMVSFILGIFMPASFADSPDDYPPNNAADNAAVVRERSRSIDLNRSVPDPESPSSSANEEEKFLLKCYSKIERCWRHEPQKWVKPENRDLDDLISEYIHIRWGGAQKDKIQHESDALFRERGHSLVYKDFIHFLEEEKEEENRRKSR